MIARSLKAKALVFAIFFVGIATGAVMGNFYATRVALSADGPNRTQRAQGDINRFYDYLGLDQDQRSQMHKIGEETRQKFQALREETSPRYQAIQEESRARIRAVLNDAQRAKYDDFRKRMDERRLNHSRDANKNDRDPGPERGPRPQP
jgi:hypothetical protein